VFVCFCYSILGELLEEVELLLPQLDLVEVRLGALAHVGGQAVEVGLDLKGKAVCLKSIYLWLHLLIFLLI